MIFCWGNANSCCISCKVVCYQIVIVIKGIEMAYNVGNPMFKGSLVALITPFANGVIDESASVSYTHLTLPTKDSV